MQPRDTPGGSGGGLRGATLHRGRKAAHREGQGEGGPGGAGGEAGHGAQGYRASCSAGSVGESGPKGNRGPTGEQGASGAKMPTCVYRGTEALCLDSGLSPEGIDLPK